MFTLLYDNLTDLLKLFKLTKAYDFGSASVKTLKRNKSKAKLKKFNYDSKQDATDKFDNYKPHHEDDYAKAEQMKADPQMSKAEHVFN